MRHAGVAARVRNKTCYPPGNGLRWTDPEVITFSFLFRYKFERYDILPMRYHYEKPTIYSSLYGSIYECDHAVYDVCTLFKINEKGLAVIQQRYDPHTKSTYWGEIDPWLTDDLYLHTRFEDFFNERAGECRDGLYPTVTIRQLMWGLKMKPMPKERWETCFDRRAI